METNIMIMSQRQRDVFCPDAYEIKRLLGNDKLKLRDYIKATLDDYQEQKDIDELLDSLEVVIEALGK